MKRMTSNELRRAFLEFFHDRGHEIVAQLPPKNRRTSDDAQAAEMIHAAARAVRSRFLRRHAASVYDALTARCTRFLRLDELCRLAAIEFPGLVPTAAQLEAEARLSLREKEGLEIDQGLFIEDAVENAIQTAAKTLKHLEWFEVTETRGHIVDGKVGHYQVVLKAGFRIEG